MRSVTVDLQFLFSLYSLLFSLYSLHRLLVTTSKEVVCLGGHVSGCPRRTPLPPCTPLARTRRGGGGSFIALTLTRDSASPWPGGYRKRSGTVRTGRSGLATNSRQFLAPSPGDYPVRVHVAALGWMDPWSAQSPRELPSYCTRSYGIPGTQIVR